MTLKEWRLRPGKEMTQEEVAKKLDVSVSAVSRWEAGTTPEPKHVAAIYDMTGGKVHFRDWIKKEGGK